MEKKGKQERKGDSEHVLYNAIDSMNSGILAISQKLIRKFVKYGKIEKEERERIKVLCIIFHQMSK